MAATTRSARRRLLPAVAAVGLFAACGLTLAPGPAAYAQSRLNPYSPGPGEWWFSGWRVQQKVWPLTEGAGVTVAEVESGVQASVPDLRGVVLPGANLTGPAAPAIPTSRRGRTGTARPWRW